MLNNTTEREQVYQQFIRNSHLWYEQAIKDTDLKNAAQNKSFQELSQAAEQFLNNEQNLLDANLFFLLTYINNDLRKIDNLFRQAPYQAHKDFLQRLALAFRYNPKFAYQYKSLFILSIKNNLSLDHHAKHDFFSLLIFALLHLAANHGWSNNTDNDLILDLIAELPNIFKDLNDYNILDIYNNTVLYYACKIKYAHPQISSLIASLLSRITLETLTQNKNAIMGASLDNPHKKGLKLIFKRLDFSIIELEILLKAQTNSLKYHYDNSDKVNNFQSNVLIIIEKLASFCEWRNYSLMINGKSLWHNEIFCDLKMIEMTAKIIASFHDNTGLVFNAIIANNNYATFQIISCVIMHETVAQHDNILKYLALNPNLCLELNKPMHYSMLSSSSTVYPRATNNIIKLCADLESNPLDLAIASNNMPFYLLILRLAGKEINLLKNLDFANFFANKFIILMETLHDEQRKILIDYLKTKASKWLNNYENKLLGKIHPNIPKIKLKI